MVAVSNSGRIIRRERCETTIPALAAALEGVRRPRILTFEEGPLADWLARNLRPHVDRLIVCEPRRNALIAKDSDKDDPIDAERLAQPHAPYAGWATTLRRLGNDVSRGWGRGGIGAFGR